MLFIVCNLIFNLIRDIILFVHNEVLMKIPNFLRHTSYCHPCGVCSAVDNNICIAHYECHVRNKRQGTGPLRNISSKKGGNRNLFVPDNNNAA